MFSVINNVANCHESVPIQDGFDELEIFGQSFKVRAASLLCLFCQTERIPVELKAILWS